MPNFDPFGLADIGRKLQAILHALDRIEKGQQTMAGELAALQASVARVKTVEDSAIALLQGLKAQLDAAIASGDPAALQALSDALGTDSDALAAAVTANTPVTP
jgi:hypothetical protein